MSVAVSSISLAILVNVHLGTCVEWLDVQCLITSLETGLTRQFSTLRIGCLICCQGRAFILERLLVDISTSRDVVRAFNELHGKTAIKMPRDVAMHEPGSWVVSLEANDGISGRLARASTTLQHDSVAAHGVREVQRACLSRAEVALALTKDGHIMAVDVHRMGDKELVLDDEINPLVLLCEGDSIADGVVRSSGQGLEGWVVEIDVNDSIVEKPLEDGAIIIGGNRGQGTTRNG